MTLKSKRLEFFITPKGRVMYQINDNESYIYNEEDEEETESEEIKSILTETREEV